jgi:hypothetical protein
MIGQRTATRLRSERRRDRSRLRTRAFGCLVRFQLFQSELQLFDLPLHFFRAPAKLHTLQFREQQLQVCDLALTRSQPLLRFKQLLMLGEEQGQQAFAIQLLHIGEVCVHA